MRAFLVALLVASPAAADDKPDPAIGEPNLESISERQGFAFTFAVGGAATIGVGINDSTGTGGSAVFRLTRVATPRALVMLEITGSGLLHQVDMGSEGTKTYVNQLTHFLVGGQIYVNPALWFRIAAGFSRYFGDHVTIEQEPMQPRVVGDTRLAGPAGSVGAGVDFVRLKRVRIGAELMLTGTATRDGLLSSGGFLFGLTVD